MNLKTPEFYQNEDFRTILWRAEDIDNENDTPKNVSQNVSQNDRQNDRQKLGKRQQKLLRLIGDNIYISAEGIAQKLNVTVRTVYRELKTLHIKWSGSAKTGHWVFEK
ncbi:MAG: HTH domain-containing protein [Bacteroidales bacterium]|nr:HTH domain-containing protein [Bacteroidales bacterium]